ncbi:hypothetical protein [Streptomyces sp. NRRL B-1347]|uniref:hypothetical protein n=1 Tax=Streptomyces sp. NRRL B-1347 TaxID=1476877 RepID=UPI0004C5A5F9|nr:hypothetical protein [Streptomyces sp. NRRL B-1347]
MDCRDSKTYVQEEICKQYPSFVALYPHLEDKVSQERYATLAEIAGGVLIAEAPLVPQPHYWGSQNMVESGIMPGSDAPFVSWDALFNLAFRIIARTVANPNQITQESAGDGSHSFSPNQGMGMRLTAAERKELARICGEQSRTVWL